VTQPALRVIDSSEHEDERAGGRGWLAWLHTHLDPAWRRGEWDREALLFTGDLDGDRTAAWPCRTPGCLTATRFHHRRCDGCRRARVSLGVGWEDFDAATPPRVTRPLLPVGHCAVNDCDSELHSRGLCFRHERAWRKGMSEPVEAFAARAHPLRRGPDCLIAGCAREHVTRRKLCRFHDQRLRRSHRVAALSPDELAAWVAAERPRLAVHQFSLAGLPDLLAAELLYGLQQRDKAPPPLGPHSGADLARPAGRCRFTASRRPRGRLRVRRHAVQLRQQGAVR